MRPAAPMAPQTQTSAQGQPVMPGGPAPHVEPGQSRAQSQPQTTQHQQPPVDPNMSTVAPSMGSVPLSMSTKAPPMPLRPSPAPVTSSMSQVAGPNLTPIEKQIKKEFNRIEEFRTKSEKKIDARPHLKNQERDQQRTELKKGIKIFQDIRKQEKGIIKSSPEYKTFCGGKSDSEVLYSYRSLAHRRDNYIKNPIGNPYPKLSPKQEKELAFYEDTGRNFIQALDHETKLKDALNEKDEKTNEKKYSWWSSIIS